MLTNKKLRQELDKYADGLEVNFVDEDSYCRAVKRVACLQTSDSDSPTIFLFEE